MLLLFGAYKKEKKDLLRQTEFSRQKSETNFIDPARNRLEVLPKQCLAQLLREEEVKWYQRAKAKHILHGDMNTKYFQLLANGKHKTTRIFQLQDGDRIIEGDEALKKYITSYYKGLFSKSIENNFRLDESFKEDIPQVTERENDILIQPFFRGGN
jgi:hypothetical protein